MGPDLLAREDRNGFAHTGLVRILECRADKRIVLDDAYIPPCVGFKTSPRLAGFVGELLGLLHHCGEALAARVGGSGRGAVAEWADFPCCKSLVGSNPLPSTWRRLGGVCTRSSSITCCCPWPGSLLATFTVREKHPPEFPTYRHDDPAGTFEQCPGGACHPYPD